MSSGALAHQRSGLAHDLAALGGHHIAPDLEALLGRLERAVEVGPAGVRHASDLLAGRGFTTGRVLPSAGCCHLPSMKSCVSMYPMVSSRSVRAGEKLARVTPFVSPFYFTSSSSTSKTSVALGGITPPAPRAP